MLLNINILPNKFIIFIKFYVKNIVKLISDTLLLQQELKIYLLIFTSCWGKLPVF